MDTIYFDIGTVPTKEARAIAGIRSEIEADKANIIAPSNYKDTVKIAAYIADKSAELIKWCGVKGKGLMDSVCYALGIPSKSNTEDVERTRSMFKHMTFAA